jgi:hypothetical protein
MEYDKEFEKFVARTIIDLSWTMKDRLWAVWQAARKDHYRIGEEVEIRFSPDDEYEPATICASSRDKTGGYLSYTPNNVRRIPAWTPKEGEAVLFENTQGLAEAGNAEKVSRFVTVRCSNGIAFTGELCQLKPFSADKIGKPWEEI